MIRMTRMMMKIERRRLMTFIENEYTELKSTVVSDICKEIIAFANTKGGTLYVGVADDGSIIGVDNADKVTLQLSEQND